MKAGALPGSRPRFSLKPSTILWIVLGIAAVVTVLLNLNELRGVVRVASHGDFTLLPALIAVEGVFILNMGLFYWSTFRATDAKASLTRFIPLAAAGHFVNLVSKSSGFGALALYLSEGRRRGDSPVRVSLAFLVSYALGYAAFLSVLVLALVLLYARGSLTTVEMVGAGIIFAVVLVVASVIVAGLRSLEALDRLYLLLIAPLNFVARIAGRSPFVDEAKARETTGELFEAVAFMKSRPRRVAAPFAYALGIELFGAVFLYLVALSLHAGIGFPTAVAGYALSLMFAILSVTPGGLGFVEASLTIFLASTGLSRQQAIAVTLGYRLFDFWLPVLVGIVSLAVLRFGGRTEQYVLEEQA